MLGVARWLAFLTVGDSCWSSVFGAGDRCAKYFHVEWKPDFCVFDSLGVIFDGTWVNKEVSIHARILKRVGRRFFTPVEINWNSASWATAGEGAQFGWAALHRYEAAAGRAEGLSCDLDEFSSDHFQSRGVIAVHYFIAYFGFLGDAAGPK